VANGHVLGPNHDPNEMRPQLIRNDGRGFFDDISPAAGPYFQDLWLGRGAAGGDYDNDGDVDIVVTHLFRPMALLRNDTETQRGFIGLDLHTASRIPAIGARVKITSGDRAQILSVTAGGSYLCNPDPRLLASVDASISTASVVVEWPSGKRDQFDNLAINRYWQIHEGGATIDSEFLLRDSRVENP
jgi:hypothetical protein